jgi:hypothetical protein
VIPRGCPMTVSHVAGAGIVYVRCNHLLLSREVICACCMDRDYDHAALGTCSTRGERLSEQADAVASNGPQQGEQGARVEKPSHLSNLGIDGQRIDQRASDGSDNRNESDHGVTPAVQGTTTGQYDVTLTRKGRKALRKLQRGQQ